MEGPDLGAGKKTAAALGAWLVFEDETGQSVRPPRARTWAPRGHTPVIRVRGGGTGSVPVAGLACYRPGFRPRLICRYHEYHGRLRARRRRSPGPGTGTSPMPRTGSLPGGKIVLIWNNLNIHAQAGKLALNGRSWLRIYRFPPYAPDLNPVEGIWSSLMALSRQPVPALACLPEHHDPTRPVRGRTALTGAGSRLLT